MNECANAEQVQITRPGAARISAMRTERRDTFGHRSDDIVNRQMYDVAENGHLLR